MKEPVFNPPVHDEVITVLGACTLTGRSNAAVRHAAREGLVTTRAVIQFDAKPIRLLSLDSVLEYWDLPQVRPEYKKEVEHMREGACVVHDSGWRFRILHPMPLVWEKSHLPGTTETWVKEKGFREEKGD